MSACYAPRKIVKQRFSRKVMIAAIHLREYLRIRLELGEVFVLHCFVQFAQPILGSNMRHGLAFQY
jgi:hypothetical protein